MADHAARLASLFRVQARYNITPTIQLLSALREFADKLARHHGNRISAQALSDVIDDVLCAFPHWTDVQDKLFVSVAKMRLDPHTLRKFMRCDLDISVRKIHPRSLRVIDAFLQIVLHDPPDFLRKYLAQDSSEES